MGVFEGEKITERDAFRYIKLSRFLQKKGFRVKGLEYDVTRFNILPTTPLIDKQPPIVYIDDVRAFNPITDVMLSGIDEMYYEHFGAEGGSDSGTIYIYRKYGRNGYENGNKLLQKIAEVGFSTSSSETKLKFTDFIKNHFVSHGNVYWNGNIEIKKDGAYQVKFPTYALKEFRMFINGVSDKGDIISSSKYISLED